MQPAAHGSSAARGRRTPAEERHTREEPRRPQSAAQDGSGATVPKRYRPRRQHLPKSAAANPDQGNRGGRNLPTEATAEEPAAADEISAQNQKPPPTEESAGNPNHLPRQSGRRRSSDGKSGGEYRSPCQKISTSGAADLPRQSARRTCQGQPSRTTCHEISTSRERQPRRQDQGGSTRSPCQSYEQRPEEQAAEAEAPASEPPAEIPKPLYQFYDIIQAVTKAPICPIYRA